MEGGYHYDLVIPCLATDVENNFILYLKCSCVVIKRDDNQLATTIKFVRDHVKTLIFFQRLILFIFRDLKVPNKNV